MPGACIVPVGTESAHNEGMGATLRVQWLTLRSGRRALRVREVICDLTFLFGLPQQPCGVAHSADLQPVVSEPCCFQPNEQLHCLLWHCCDRRVQGRSTRLCHRNHTCGVRLLTRPAKCWPMSEQPWLEKAIAADIANTSEVREGIYAAFSRQRAQFDYRRFDGPRGAGVEQALTLGPSDLSASV